MYLGIEIGGTKLQLGVSEGREATLIDVRREKIVPQNGSQGILDQIGRLGRELMDAHPVTAVGIGFGGPVDLQTGQIVTSHQVEGWDHFRLSTGPTSGSGCRSP